MTSHAEHITELLRAHQERLVAAFEKQDGAARFRDAPWTRQGLGGGRARILERGGVFERAGVNVSLVSGDEVPSAVSRDRPQLAGKPFVATGISLVLHPLNPYAPSFHANFRYFEIADEEWWFGGGLDLTPMYGFDEDAVHFHRTLKAWCDRHEIGRYEEWKKTCDDYFHIPHRGEMRGIGGVFFDRLTEPSRRPPSSYLAFVDDGLRTVLDSYLPIVARRASLPYGEREREWQLVRRGRYAEFNLVYDRGTLFGLQTKANIEAVLMSMPPMARWGFEIVPSPGSPEADATRFLQPRDWAGEAGRGV
ncbi:oxygen-dependent coproporphyrinogen oxidase [Actinomadura rupiterrae]|uniref:oxygen-dependent coproporphyrinogen oxidase n=1 Tax=Actinomadura rupiterrae TaxID=559627 RepID=UPI0020A52BD4|nr:oxygen-dependent coproporphyrinogen oxidase [Actinomadura rupiterrae]MCP2342812.1 coproporphyrinogen III oxidase [Actinomadura rupiterrae]